VKLRKSQFILGVIITTMSISSCSSNSEGVEPQPAKTVYVPVPQPGLQSNSQNNFESDLQEIKDANCRLAQDLLMQSLDLEDQARNLERQAYSLGSESDLYFKMKTQARDMQDQALNLMIRSGQLRQNC
jgi:hypothetical protein